MTEDRKENLPLQDEAVRESSTSKETEGLTRRKVLKGAAGVGAAVAVAYAPPSLRRIVMPSALAKTSPGKEDGEKDPASDKSGDKTTDKDPNEKETDKTTDKTSDKNPMSDKDPSLDKTIDKDPFEKDPEEKAKEVSDKDPDEKNKEAESSQNVQNLPRFARTFFDEWS